MSIAQVLAEGRLIRGAWSREENGRQLLCLYTAMVGDPGARPEDCPAHVCPLWLAHMIPWIDDAGSEAHWHSVVARVARLAPHFGRLPVSTEWRVRTLCVRDAMRRTTDLTLLEICERVATLCETGAPDLNELGKAEMAAADAWPGLEPWAEIGAVAWAEVPAPEVAETAWMEEETVAAADRLIDSILDEIERSLEAA